VISSQLATLRRAVQRRVSGLHGGARDLQVWRTRLLDGLYSVALGLGLVVAAPSMWGAMQQNQWPLALTDLLALACVGALHFQRNLAYRLRVIALLAVIYAVAVALLFALGPLTQIYLLAIPVLCTILIGNVTAALAVVGCSSTLFVAGYYGGIQPGLAPMTVSPLLHWSVLSLNFSLVATVLVLSCAFLLHGLDGSLARQRKIHERERRQEMALRESVAAQRAAEVSSQLKSEFLAMISHEVRTPLGGVISMLQLAQKDGSLRADTRGKLHISLSNAEVLLQIINDILDFSRLEAGKMPLEVIDFDLPSLLHDVADLLRERAESKGLSLLVEIDPALATWWRGDPIRLRQVALNLIGNGIKFTERGEVKLSAVLSLDGGIQIRVRDTGIGIAPEAIRRLFQKFEQADAATSREYGGTGLGLAICKHLVSAMAGQIDVCSTQGQGSEFTVRLPLHPGRPSLSHQEALSRPHGARLHVLCAEDGHTNQIILRELLENMGHTMAMAQDGQAALEELARNDYDLLILDSRMPRMDGLTALRQLRAGADGVRDAAIPVIALTANATAEERLRFLTAGADGFLPKPIDELALHGEIARQIDLLLAQGKPLVGERSAQATGAPSLAELDAMFGVAAHGHTSPCASAHAAAALPAAEARRTVLWAAFQLESPRLLAAMQDAARDGDAAALALNAHTLLGSASHFGVDAVTAHCASIERLADAGDLQAATPHLAALKTALAAALHWQA